VNRASKIFRVNFGKVLQIFTIAGGTAEVYFRLYYTRNPSSPADPQGIGGASCYRLLYRGLRR
jgi:hypothetical protein